MKKFSFMLSILIFLSSCMFSSNSSVAFTPSATAFATSESSYKWWMQWLTQTVCKPPCWRSITPGETSMNDAVTILENMPDILITYNGKYGVDWKFKNTRAGGDMRMSGDGNVSSIRLGRSLDEKILLEKVVASYGFPAFVELYDCREGLCSTNLIYPDLGMLLDVSLENIGKDASQVKIQSDTTVESVLFFPKGLENFRKIPDYQGFDLLAWKGYSEYP